MSMADCAWAPLQHMRNPWNPLWTYCQQHLQQVDNRITDDPGKTSCAACRLVLAAWAANVMGVKPRNVNAPPSTP